MFPLLSFSGELSRAPAGFEESIFTRLQIFAMK
jgi:hypothetical protein